MDLIDLKTAGDAARNAALRLNAANVNETSPLDRAALDGMIAGARQALATPEGDALLLTFSPGEDYHSPNYRWFSEKYAHFLYVDRIIVGEALRGAGVGRALYATCFEIARAEECPVLCEVNFVPPNPGSDAFHARLGFAEVGRGEYVPGKVVRYLAWHPD